jgi:hypothetical protein
MTLLEKLMLCAAGAAEHYVDVYKSEDSFRDERSAARKNLREAVAAVKAQRKFLEENREMPGES